MLCESPITLSEAQCKELFIIARENHCVLMDAIKTAYATAYHRMLLLVKTGIIGNPRSIDATCTSIRSVDMSDPKAMERSWNSISAWGPTALLPVLQILGQIITMRELLHGWIMKNIIMMHLQKLISVILGAVASVKVGQGVKSEGELVISGTKGYIYVPAPWWKTEYFEVRFENPENNRRYFYQLDGEEFVMNLSRLYVPLSLANV